MGQPPTFLRGGGASDAPHSDRRCPAQTDGKTVKEKEERVRDLGISGVPTFIFDRKSGLSGAYPPEQLAQAIREATSP